jgi:hypothetical protein
MNHIAHIANVTAQYSGTIRIRRLGTFSHADRAHNKPGNHKKHIDAAVADLEHACMEQQNGDSGDGAQHLNGIYAWMLQLEAIML